MYCMECGKKLPDDSVFCPFCGTFVIRNQEDSFNETGIQSDPKAFTAPKMQEMYKTDASSDPSAEKTTPAAEAPGKPETMQAGTPVDRPAEKTTPAAEAPKKPETLRKPERMQADIPVDRPAEKTTPAAETLKIQKSHKTEAFPDSSAGKISVAAASSAAAPRRKQGSLDPVPSLLRNAGEAPVYADVSSTKESGVKEYNVKESDASTVKETAAPDVKETDRSGLYAELPVTKKPGGSVDKKRKPGKKKGPIIGGIIIAAILIAVLTAVLKHNATVKKYNEGVAAFDSKNYEEALEIFTDLGSYEDSEYRASFTQMELDYLKLDELVSSGDYAQTVEILRRRSEFYGDTDTGKDAAALADEYETVSKAYEAKGSADYAQAVEYFESLVMLRDDYGKDRCLCHAHVAEEKQDWQGIVLNLYAVQNNDTEYEFLDNPKTDADSQISKYYKEGEGLDPDQAADILQPEGDEAGALKTTAVNGMRYIIAKDLLDSKKYEKAMKAFENLGDFLDSADLYAEAKDGYDACEAAYKEAKEYYDNGEYYKAREKYLSISDYKDAGEKAESCKQTMPDNGALKKGNGSATSMTIYAPDSSLYVFLKMYDSQENAVGQVFIHPGSNATISMKAGTYTIKVGYGKEWYGEKDLFGKDGGYFKLKNGSDYNFEMKNNYTYTLELMVGESGNVGSENIGGADGM